MNKKFTFCEECRDDVEYTTTEIPMTGTIKGIAYPYIGIEARCAHCQSLVYVAEVNDYNLSALYDVYRQKNGIIPLKAILEIPKKYHIGKRPLSRLLGWGEQTLSRYCDGDIPTKQYSDVLKRIYESPAYYAELLESGKELLSSHAAYEKSKKATQLLLGTSMETPSKLEKATKYILAYSADITPLALQKILYYIQGFYYAFYNAFLFAEDCEAWVHGPVYRSVYQKYRDYRFNPITEKPVFDESVLTTSEKAIFESVVKNFCCYSGKTLEYFTHSETPWILARGDLGDAIVFQNSIPLETIGLFFKSVKTKYNMQTPEDIGIYALDMFDALR